MTVLFTTATIPAPPVQVEPSGTVLTATPAFVWNAVSNATSYAVWDSNSGLVHNFTAAAAGCPSGTGTCSVTLPPLTLGTSTQWVVNANNVVGTSAWSPIMTVNF